MYKVTLPAPLTVNDTEIKDIILTRAQTAEDTAHHSINLQTPVRDNFAI